MENPERFDAAHLTIYVSGWAFEDVIHPAEFFVKFSVLQL
jgi:hypothetical protein